LSEGLSGVVHHEGRHSQLCHVTQSLWCDTTCHCCDVTIVFVDTVLLHMCLQVSYVTQQQCMLGRWSDVRITEIIYYKSDHLVCSL